MLTDIDTFHALQIAVGTVTSCTLNRKAKVPAYCMEIDFGALGSKQSSAQLTQNYQADELLNQQVIAIINLPARRVAGYRSEVLVLGALNGDHGTVLLRPERPVTNGTIIA